MKTILQNSVLILLIGIFSFIGYISIWYVHLIGNVEFDKIMFHIFMPLKQAHIDWMEGICFPIYLTILNILGIVYAWYKFSDHFTKKNQSDFKGLEQIDFRYAGNIHRKVYNSFINSSITPIKMTYRKFSVFDMFPTILAALGAQIERNKLGLGVNLFSDEKTLLEEYDLNYIFNELRKKSHFYNNQLLYKQSL